MAAGLSDIAQQSCCARRQPRSLDRRRALRRALRGELRRACRGARSLQAPRPGGCEARDPCGDEEHELHEAPTGETGDDRCRGARAAVPRHGERDQDEHYDDDQSAGLPDGHQRANELGPQVSSSQLRRHELRLRPLGRRRLFGELPGGHLRDLRGSHHGCRLRGRGSRDLYITHCLPPRRERGAQLHEPDKAGVEEHRDVHKRNTVGIQRVAHRHHRQQRDEPCNESKEDGALRDRHIEAEAERRKQLHQHAVLEDDDLAQLVAREEACHREGEAAHHYRCECADTNEEPVWGVFVDHPTVDIHNQARGT
mmetsp:Transcript_60872/g.175378  ORF Transcript_60872/g.175378 Transcript_60872/m.175378 type:complete len:311 (+) Transcript_60872:25-957(+)